MQEWQFHSQAQALALQMVATYLKDKDPAFTTFVEETCEMLNKRLQNIERADWVVQQAKAILTQDNEAMK